MDPLTSQLIGVGLPELIKNEPAIAAEFARLTTQGEATPAEWQAALQLSQKPWTAFAPTAATATTTPN